MTFLSQSWSDTGTPNWPKYITWSRSWSTNLTKLARLIVWSASSNTRKYFVLSMMNRPKVDTSGCARPPHQSSNLVLRMTISWVLSIIISEINLSIQLDFGNWRMTISGWSLKRCWRCRKRIRKRKTIKRCDSNWHAEKFFNWWDAEISNCCFGTWEPEEYEETFRSTNTRLLKVVNHFLTCKITLFFF